MVDGSLQTRLIRFVSRKSSVVILFIIFLSSIISLYFSVKTISQQHFLFSSNEARNAAYSDPLDTIGYKDVTSDLRYPQVDAVYTWVNGSDPVWFAEMQKYKQLYNKEHNITVEETGDTATSANRFRDNDELKYSLRSLEVNAPWIRNVYIVTNGQVPSWIDTSNPHLKIISHQEIFKDQSALPTFSSPAIEMNLHHIPDLSDYFIYFNDDVFLGSPVHLTDFMTLQKGQVLFGSWEVPECSKKCRYSQLGDGICDFPCNTEMCGFDFGDCDERENEKKKQFDAVMSELENHDYEDLLPLSVLVKDPTKVSDIQYCFESCGVNWISDGSCDKRCNNADCGYDGYDCPLPPSHNDSILKVPVECTEDDTIMNMEQATAFLDHAFGEHFSSFCLSRIVSVINKDSFIDLDLSAFFTVHPNALKRDVKVNVVEKNYVLKTVVNQSIQRVMVILTPKARDSHCTIHLHLDFTLSFSHLHYFIEIIHVAKNPSDFELLQSLIHHKSSFPNPLSNLLTTFFTHDDLPAVLHMYYQSRHQLACLNFRVGNTTIPLYEQDPASPLPGDDYFGTVHLQKPSQLTQATIHVHTNQNKMAWLGVKEQVQTKVYSMMQETTCFNNMRAIIQQGIDLEPNVDYTFPSVENIEIPLFSTEHLLASLFDVDYQVYQEYETVFTELINKKKGSKDSMIVLSFPVQVNVTCRLSQLPSNINLLSMNDITASTTILPFSVSFDIVFNFTSQSSRRLVEEEIEDNSIESLLSQNILSRSFQDTFYQRNITSLSSLQSYITSSFSSHRRLADTYRSSLIYTNLQLIKMFGKKTRYVPAHMPHLINKHVMNIIESNMTTVYNQTIHHRFREDNDLQYAFLYFHYLYHLEYLKKSNHSRYLWSILDKDQDGQLNQKELTTLAIMVFGDNYNSKQFEDLIKCLVPKAEKQSLMYENEDGLFNKKYYSLNITYQSFISCDQAFRTVDLLFPFNLRFEKKSDVDVAFQMIHDDYDDTKKQLDSVRQRKSKFVCINDDLTDPSSEMKNLINNFYESFFPIPSQFEKHRKSITFQKSISNWVSLIRTNYYVNYILYLVVIAFVISIILIIVLDISKPSRRTIEVQV